jgi:hypothetical protein
MVHTVAVIRRIEQAAPACEDRGGASCVRSAGDAGLRKIERLLKLQEAFGRHPE